MRIRDLGISPQFCITAALMILVLPLKWLIAAAAAAAIHEAGHAAAVYLCGGRIRGFRIDSGGAVIDAEPMTAGREVICTLAGPMGGLLLLLTASQFPRLALCGAVHSLYNLLPLYPLDGGRALRTVVQLLGPRYADDICCWTERICMAAVWTLAAYAAFVLKLGLVPVLLAFALWLKIQKVKIPCKPPL